MKKPASQTSSTARLQYRLTTEQSFPLAPPGVNGDCCNAEERLKGVPRRNPGRGLLEHGGQPRRVPRPARPVRLRQVHRAPAWSPASRPPPTARSSSTASTPTTCPRERNAAMIFQTFALYPHMSVADNIGFPLKLGKQNGAQSVPDAVGDMASALGISDLKDRKPEPALGRSAAARGHGPGAGAPPQALPHGRAAVEPRRGPARGAAHRDLLAGAPPSTRPRCT